MLPNTLSKLFAGPSLTSAAKSLALAKGIQIEPPIKRGDLPQLISADFRGNIIIADGLFYRTIPVGHIELREAIEAGCTLYGLSSMGAIRAFEMRELGMKGFGKVYQYFFKLDDFQDDELALLHAPIPPYFAISEPMVHLRYCLDELEKSGEITDEVKNTILDVLKVTPFGERTLKKFLSLLKQSNYQHIDELENRFDQFRIKQLDLYNFLDAYPEI